MYRYSKIIIFLCFVFTSTFLMIYLGCTNDELNDPISCVNNADCPADCNCDKSDFAFSGSCQRDDNSTRDCYGNTCVEDSDCNSGKTCQGTYDSDKKGYVYSCQSANSIAGIWEETFSCVIDDGSDFGCVDAMGGDDRESSTFEMTESGSTTRGRQTAPVEEADPTFEGPLSSGKFKWTSTNSDEEGCWTVSSDLQSLNVRSFGTSAGFTYVCVGRATKGAGSPPPNPLTCADLADQVNNGDLNLVTDFGTPGHSVCPPAPPSAGP